MSRLAIHEHMHEHAYDDAFDLAAELFKSLASPVRLRILAALSERPQCVHELVETLVLSQSLVSQHLRVLRGARLVGYRRRGKEMVYSLQDGHVGKLVSEALTHSKEEG
jgi:ArsR family transcriptional regulator, zinc-responsive transcriptional repressor